MGLRVRGETVDEITGAVRAMRAKMLAVTAPADAIDMVGTGGDGSGTYNISTCAAFVVAGCGVPVAKHGNRALSSKSGAADVLAALGVKIDIDAGAGRPLHAEAGIGFMFAPTASSGDANVGPTRVELGTRTIFNLLGPLSNPAGVKRQMVGVFSPAMGASRWRRCWRISAPRRSGWCTAPTGSTRSPPPGRPTSPRWKTARSPPSRSRPRTSACRAPRGADLTGGDAEANAAALLGVLQGEPRPLSRRRAAERRRGADRRRRAPST